MIHDLAEKIKSWGGEIFVAITSVLAVLLVVGGVRLWGQNSLQEPIQYLEGAFRVEFAPKAEALFVASKNGSKYYPIDCSSANRIKEDNKIFFGSEEEALDLGFERTSSCR